METNGDFLAAIGRLLDEKLAPVQRELADTRSAVENLREAIKRLNVRLAVVEALLDVDPRQSKH